MQDSMTRKPEWARPLRSKTATVGRNMAAARSLWRATGMTDGDFGKPIIAVVNSFCEFVPGLDCNGRGVRRHRPGGCGV